MTIGLKRRPRSHHARKGWASAAVVLAYLIAPSTATATTVTVSGFGTDEAACSAGTHACRTVQYAVTNAAAGSTIDILPDAIYTETVSVSKVLNVRGHAGGPRPEILSTGTFAVTLAFNSASAGSTLSHLDLEASGSVGIALEDLGGATMTDLTLTSTDRCAYLNPAAGVTSTLGPNVTGAVTGSTSTADACVEADGGGGVLGTSRLLGLTVTEPTAQSSGASGPPAISMSGDATLTDSGAKAANTPALIIAGGAVARRDMLDGGSNGIVARGALVSDSIATASQDSGVGVLAAAGSVVLRNVTAVAPGAGSNGLEAVGGCPLCVATRPTGRLDVKNTIVRGGTGGVDVALDPAPNPCESPPCAPGAATISYSNFVTTGGAGGPPDTSGGHNQSGAPGFVNPTVGASENFHIASASSPVIGAGIADPPKTGTTDRDGVAWLGGDGFGIGAYKGPRRPAPTLSALTVNPDAFRPDPTGTMRAASKHKTGTTIGYRDTQPATTTLTVLRGRPGVKKGKLCVKPPKHKSVKPGRRCNRYTRVGSFTHNDVAGRNSFHFAGYVKGHKLLRGKYRLDATPLAHGRTGRTVSTGFRIKR